MKRWPVLLPVFALVAAGCRDSSAPLKEPISGFSDTEESESYNRATLYTYMDGGAEVYLEYGFSSLDVRRYARGSERYLVELYKMKDGESASAIYTYTRRTGKEAELLPGCLAGITPAEVQLARGTYYLVCRNEDPMAKRSPSLRELALQLAERLPGDCGVGDLFSRLPAERRVSGSEIALFGPIALNVRPWLASLGRAGFSRGWLATYTLPAGQVETLLAEYASPQEANRAVADYKKSEEPDVVAERREESVVLVRAPGVPRDDLGSLVSSLLSPPEWR
ncbi:MAG: hypothetical protein EHM61_20770 [Acidobacteria bacterium]|nr:MAG: hypothetical protein EHM61_20770 [Acidobacteriota bacterium]